MKPKPKQERREIGAIKGAAKNPRRITDARLSVLRRQLAERFEQIELLQAAGHHVWAGVNPLVRDWIPDVKSFAKRLRSAGIKHVWSEVLHLTMEQINRMNPREREAIGEPVLKAARQKNISKDAINHEMDLIDACRDEGIEFGCKHWPERTSCLEPYRQRYPKLFPTMTEFTNHSIDTMKPGDEITFDEWRDFMMLDLPEIPRKREMASYIYSCNQKLGKENATNFGLDYSDVLRIVWCNREHKMNPSRSFAFKKVRIGDVGGKPLFKQDANGFPVRYCTGKTLVIGGDAK